MTINEKISEIRKLFCGGDNKKFAEMLGFSPQYASNICKEGKSVGESQKIHILSVFPNINKSWLFADEGEMLKEEQQENTICSPDIENSISIPPNVWEVISNQAESLKMKDTQINTVFDSLKSKDAQITTIFDSLKSKDAQMNALFDNLKSKDAQLDRIINLLEDKINHSPHISETDAHREEDAECADVG